MPSLMTMTVTHHAQAAAAALEAALAMLATAEVHTREAGMNVTCGVVKDAMTGLRTAQECTASWAAADEAPAAPLSLAGARQLVWQLVDGHDGFDDRDKQSSAVVERLAQAIHDAYWKGNLAARQVENAGDDTVNDDGGETCPGCGGHGKTY